MVGSNYTDELRTRGLTTPGAFKKLWDYNLGVGGPILKDRLWYFGQLRTEGYTNTVPGMFANANAGNPNSWTYVPDRSRPAYTSVNFAEVTFWGDIPAPGGTCAAVFEMGKVGPE